MVTGVDRGKDLEELEARLKTILPKEYQETYQTLEPAPMKSAGLKFAKDGTVAWDDIWGSFCDLAMAGGPPHKGTLLEPGAPADIDAHHARYDDVVREICRGAMMVTGLTVRPSPMPGWVRVICVNEGMAAWLLRAIVMENVAVRSESRLLDLPAAPHFRLEKEIKNVITVIAKTCHYWLGHMPRAQQRNIGTLFATMAKETPLVEPAASGAAGAGGNHDELRARIADGIQRATGFSPSNHTYAGWLGVTCPSVRGAIWMMRALVVSNVLSRREATTLFVPVNPISDPAGARVVGTCAHVYALASGRF
jgi:sirohydrochlorin cobaltochelatase